MAFFPSGRKTSGPDPRTPPRPIINLENPTLTPHLPPAQLPFCKLHTTHISLIVPTEGLTPETSALETL